MRPSVPLPAGKLPASLLQSLLAACRPGRSSGVVIGPRYGEDAAVIDVGAKYLVAKTDPITFTEERIGWYAVNINANDLATLGARPRWFLATLLLPEGRSTKGLTRRIFQDTLVAARELGVTLVGGHTEITVGLTRPLVVGLMLGEVDKAKLIRKDSQRPGDLVILTRGVAIEGTAILARAREAGLRGKVGFRLVQRAAGLLFDPGISVVHAANVAAEISGVHAMHDPTEGGLLAGLDEIARAGRVGLRVWTDKIPVLPETRAFSEALGFDPLALIASGALLIVSSAKSGPHLLKVLARHGINAAVIGEVCPRREGIWLIGNGKPARLRVPARDELARLMGEPQEPLEGTV